MSMTKLCYFWNPKACIEGEKKGDKWVLGVDGVNLKSMNLKLGATSNHV